ncbi:MAG: substrate-binding domain-containing protein, partial [Pseudolysinimonas sp.]
AAVASFVAGSVLLGSLLGGCSAPDDSRTIAVVLPNEDGRFGDVADELGDRLGVAGYDVVVRSSDGDIPLQVTTVGELLDAKPAGLIVWPIDGTSLTPVVDAAPAGVQVMALGGRVDDTVRLDRVVGFDPSAAGTLQAQSLLDGLGALTEPRRIELFLGSPESAATEPGYAAIMTVLRPYLDAGVLVVGSGEVGLDEVTTLRGNDDTAASRMTRILRDSYAGGFPDAVLASSDQIAQGVSTALIDDGAVPGEGFPLVTGRGGELRSLVAILDGRQFSTLIEDPRRLAAEAADQMIAALADTTPDPSVDPDTDAGAVPASLVEPVPVRADDIGELVIGTGYWSRARLDEAIAEFGLPTEPAATASPTPTPTP